MLKKEGTALKVLISLVILIAVSHSFAHIIIFKTNLSLVKTIGLSGFAVGGINTEQVESSLKKNPEFSSPSVIIIGAEWTLLFSLITLFSIKRRIAKLNDKTTPIEMVKEKSKTETDIDTLYRLLQKNKKITLSKAAEIFKVDKKIIEGWGEILENNHLAIVDYPRFGEVEIRLNEEAQ